MTVQRWSHEHPTECVQMRYEHGDWVRYADHERALTEARADAIRECIAVVEAEKPDIRGQLGEYDSGYRQASEDTYAFHLTLLRALLPEEER